MEEKDFLKDYLNQTNSFLSNIKKLIDEVVSIKKDLEKTIVDKNGDIKAVYKQFDIIVEWLNKQSQRVGTKMTKLEDTMVGLINETSKRTRASQKKLEEELKADILAFWSMFENVKEMLSISSRDTERMKEEMEEKLWKKLEKNDLDAINKKLKKKFIDDENISDKTAYSSKKVIEKIDSMINNLRLWGRGKLFILNKWSDIWQATAINFKWNWVTTTVENWVHTVDIPWGWWGWASSYEVTQNTHWFINLDWLYFDESDNTFKKAQSNAEATLWARHVVEVVDANTFKVAKDGVHEIANTLDLWEYVLSQDTAWGYTQTLPWDLWDYVLWGMEVVSSTHVSFYTVPAIPVGDTWEWVQSVVAWTGITVDNTDPLNPIINATWGSGTVTSVAISGSDWLEVDSGSPITWAWTIALWVNKTSMLSHLNVEDWADVTDATNVASAWAFMKATDDTDDITEGATNLFMSTTEQNKLWHITVTQAVDLDQMESDIAALANGMVYKGNWDASAWTFPWGWTAQAWRFYTVSVGWTVDSVVFNVDDRLVATVDNASATTYAWNWTKLDATDAVTSVFGRPGNVVATNGDYTASQITNVASGGISAVTVQTAIDELDTEKAPKTSPTFATSINGSYLTASEILITDASKNIVSAPVATYPSLAELIHLKWTTSAVQTQLNTKQPDIQFQDEGVNEGTAWGVTTIDFVWAWVTASETTGTLTVTIPWGGSWVLKAYKTADESVNNSTTLQNDNHLVLALEVNSVYRGHLTVLVSSGDVSETDWPALAFTYPTGTTISRWPMFTGEYHTETSTSSDLAWLTTSVIGFELGLTIITAWTAWNLQLQRAQIVWWVYDVTLHLWSSFILEKLN